MSGSLHTLTYSKRQQATTYDFASRVDLRTLGNNLTQNYDYYAWNEKATVDSQLVGQGGSLKNMTVGTLQNLSYLYDAVGNIKQIANPIANETNIYGYDSLNRLTSWDLNGTTETYSYETATGNLDVKAGMDLNYNDAAHKHAVTHIGNTQKYWYDANGNQTKRIIGADTYDLKYDAENRLVEVKKNSSVIATFIYDGDGKRVKSTTNGTTTTFVSGHYEITGSTITKYYFAGMSRVAMRVNSTVSYLLSDHLGSTSITTDGSGNLVSELRYKAWGEVRYPANGQNPGPSDYTYTGQYSNTDDFGLMFYNARWYDSAIGRFVQADTIIPQNQGVQAWDRYAYTNNNPLRYTDPSGHCLKEKDYAEGTLCYFENMSWKERQSWVISFAQTNGLGNWFNDMIGAIDFMTNDESLAAEGGIAEVMDAAVLQAINDGWLIHQNGVDAAIGGGGQGWADFFGVLRDRPSDRDNLIVLRLNAEQAGVDYAWGLESTQSAYSSSSELDQIYFDIFKRGADGYRSMAASFRSDPLKVSGAENTLFLGPLLLLPASDPRTSGPFLNAVGKAGYPAALMIWSAASSVPLPLGLP